MMSLYQATQAGDFAEMIRLLDAGAEVDALAVARDADGDMALCSPLVEAATLGHLDAVRLLLDHGADPSLAVSYGTTPLVAAAGNGHAAVVRELAARGADLDTAQPETDATAFHFACFRNKMECVATLVELGCDPAIKAKDGLTGKQYAEAQGHATLVERLEEATDRRRAFDARFEARWQAEDAVAQLAKAEEAADANAVALLAELEAEGSGGGSEGGQSKSQKKKEKQRRRKKAAAAAAATDGVPKLTTLTSYGKLVPAEPELELQMEAACEPASALVWRRCTPLALLTKRRPTCGCDAPSLGLTDGQQSDVRAQPTHDHPTSSNFALRVPRSSQGGRRSLAGGGALPSEPGGGPRGSEKGANFSLL
jgi:hypothetical protein